MVSWRSAFDPHHLYFVTTGAAQQRHLFQHESARRLIVDSFDCMRLRKRMKLYGFVVMPNHIHMIVQCPAEQPLSTLMRDVKKHIADRYIRQLKAKRASTALEDLRALKQRKQTYQVWEGEYLAKPVHSASMLIEKLTYIHENPCQPHWRLAPAPELYAWSSARYYILHEAAIIPLDNAMRVIEEGVTAI